MPGTGPRPRRAAYTPARRSTQRQAISRRRPARHGAPRSLFFVGVLTALALTVGVARAVSRTTEPESNATSTVTNTPTPVAELAPRGIAAPTAISTAPAPTAPSPAPAATGTATPAPIAARTPARTATPKPQRAWDTSSSMVRHDPELAAALDPVLADVDGKVAVAVKDLGSGRGVLLDASDELPAASLFKLEVLYSTFNDQVPLSEELEITDRVKSFDLGTLELEAGETLTVAEALERMVTISDNGSAILLADRVGPSRVNADLLALGLSGTHYLNDRLTMSAGDAAKLLELMARGQAVSPAASAEMVHLLLRQQINDRIPALLPKGTRVAHKTGNLPGDGVVNDVGIVYGPHSTVVVAVLIDGATRQGDAARAIARVAAASLEHFESLPPAARPTIPPQPDRPIPPTHREPRPTRTPTPSATTSATPPPKATVTPTPKRAGG